MKKQLSALLAAALCASALAGCGVNSNPPDAHYRTNPQAYTVTRRKVDSRTRLKMYLAPGGGFAISFRELE